MKIDLGVLVFRRLTKDKFQDLWVVFGFVEEVSLFLFFVLFLSVEIIGGANTIGFSLLVPAQRVPNLAPFFFNMTTITYFQYCYIVVLGKATLKIY